MLKTRIIFSALALSLGAATAQAQTANPPVNAIQQREDHANHDRWARSQGQTTSDSDTQDANASGDHDAKPNNEPGHRGELNGKLHLGEW